MSDNCPTCGQAWPPRRRRHCSECKQPILQHHKYFFLGSSVRHRDCSNPEMYPTQKLDPQATLIGGDTANASE